MLLEATVWGERVSFPSCHMMKWHEKSLAPFLSRTLIWKKLAIKKQQNANQTLPMGTTAAGSWYCSAGIGNPQWLPGSGKEIGKLYNYRFFIYLLWIISIILHLDHRCRSGLRLRATSFVDDIARWGTVTPLALDSHDYEHVFIFTRIDSIPGLLHGFHSYLWELSTMEYCHPHPQEYTWINF